MSTPGSVRTRARRRVRGAPDPSVLSDIFFNLKFLSLVRFSAMALQATHGLSRFPCKEFLYVRGVSDHAGSEAVLTRAARSMLPSKAL